MEGMFNQNSTSIKRGFCDFSICKILITAKSCFTATRHVHPFLSAVWCVYFSLTTTGVEHVAGGLFIVLTDLTHSAPL